MEPPAAAAAAGGWEGEMAKLIPCRRITQCIPANPRRVGNIVVVHGPVDGPNTWAIWATHIYTNT